MTGAGPGFPLYEIPDISVVGGGSGGSDGDGGKGDVDV